MAARRLPSVLALLPRVASSAKKPQTTSGETANAPKPRSWHQHPNTRQSLAYAASVVLALLARAKSAASSRVASSCAGGDYDERVFHLRPPPRMRVIGTCRA